MDPDIGQLPSGKTDMNVCCGLTGSLESSILFIKFGTRGVYKDAQRNERAVPGPEAWRTANSGESAQIF